MFILTTVNYVVLTLQLSFSGGVWRGHGDAGHGTLATRALLPDLSTCFSLLCAVAAVSALHCSLLAAHLTDTSQTGPRVPLTCQPSLHPPIPTLLQIPLNIAVREHADAGEPIVATDPENSASEVRARHGAGNAGYAAGAPLLHLSFSSPCLDCRRFGVST